MSSWQVSDIVDIEKHAESDKYPKVEALLYALL